jgi:hypothetical protein
MKKLVLMAVFFACIFGCKNSESPSPTNSCSSPKVIIVDASFDFTKPVTFRACSVYYFNAQNQYSIQATLTIEAGAILKFPNTGTSFIILTSGNGKILSNGTKENPVIFTSDKDDTIGGDTNNDGSTTKPAVGDWSYIALNAKGSTFKYTQFLYNGSGSGTALFEITVDDIAFDNCTFAHGKGSSAIDGRGVLSYSGAVASAPVTNCIFYDNIKPWTIYYNMSVDGSNIFHNPTNPNQKNIYNGIFVEATSNGTGPAVSWLENEVPFVYHAFYHTQPIAAVYGNAEPVMFTLAAGTIIKFVATGPDFSPGITIRSDNSSIVGKDLAGVFFTSYKDDAHGGDTNADGTATSPASGDWDGVYDAAAKINPPNYYYRWANILYAKN